MNKSRPKIGHYTRNGMAQISSFNSSIPYQPCNSITDNDVSPLSSAKSIYQKHSSIIDDSLCEITVSPSTVEQIPPPSSSSSDCHISSLVYLNPLESSASLKSFSTESDPVKIPIESSSIPSSPSEHPLDTSTSIHSASKQTTRLSQQQPSHPLTAKSPIYDVVTPSNTHQTTSQRPVFDILAKKIKPVRQNSISATVSVQQHSSTDNDNLLPVYQGEFLRQSRHLRKARRQDIKARFEKFDFNSPTTRHKNRSRRFTFVFDPSGRLAYWWTSIISLAFLYNFWIIIFRFSFHELTPNNFLIWFIFDYSCDFLYLMDIVFNFRTAYLEEGVLQTDPIKLRHYYMNTTRFYIDCLCLMPLDFLYLSIGFKSIVRVFRLVKIYRFWTFLDRTERHTNYPNLFRTIAMIHYLLAIFHWNACLIYILHTSSGLGFTRQFPFIFNNNSLNYFEAL